MTKFTIKNVFDELDALLAPETTADKPTDPTVRQTTVYEVVLREVRKASYSVGKLTGCDDAATLARELLTSYPSEHLAVIYLDAELRVQGCEIVAHGGTNAASVKPRQVFQGALAANADAVVLAHNHPSGDPTPSPEDVKMTQLIIESGNMIGVPVADHVVVARQGYCSMRDMFPTLF